MKTIEEASTTSRARLYGGYAVMILVTAAAFLWVRASGEGMQPPATAADAPGTPRTPHSNVLAHVLLALAAITLLARIIGGVFKRFLGQPAVIGEIVAGILLGPSMLGAISPAAQEFLLPTAAAPFLGILSKVGVVLFMFLVGLELDMQKIRNSTHATIAISHASILVPFLLGTTLALGIYRSYSTSDVSFTAFSLFLGVSLSVTAFPVLARILIDRGVQNSRLGTLALACAAVDDVTAWTLLAVVTAIASAEVAGAAWTIGFLVVYIVAMFLVVKPLTARFVIHEQRRQGPLSHTALAIVFVGLLLSAVATEAIGIHALFGAFLLGAILPHDGRLADGLRARLEDVVLVLFLPAFFAFTGMRTQIGLLDDAQDWTVCALIVLVATVGKLGGTLAAARLCGLGWRPSVALGVLMNTRGLMELIVLNVGLDLGVITPKVFTMLVIMALVTTFATTPILDLVAGKNAFSDAGAGENAKA